MTDNGPSNRFKVSIDDLERSAHVAPEDQVESEPDETAGGLPQLPEHLRNALEAARLGGLGG